MLPIYSALGTLCSLCAARQYSNGLVVTCVNGHDGVTCLPPVPDTAATNNVSCGLEHVVHPALHVMDGVETRVQPDRVNSMSCLESIHSMSAPPTPQIPAPPGRLASPTLHGGSNPGINLLSCPPPPAGVPPIITRPRINARSKGQRGERQVVDLLQSVINTVCGRRGLRPPTLQRNTLQAHLGGEDIHGLEGFSVEVKRCETDYNDAWWRQALKQAANRNATPVLFYRRNQKAWIVKFRAFVETPFNDDQMEMDLTVSVEDFIEWFCHAYDERLTRTTPL